MFESNEQRRTVQEECQQQACDIVNRYWFVVDELAAILLVEGFLSGRDVHTIIRKALSETGSDWRLAV